MRIANYEYSEKIGQGAFGTIYKGRNTKTGEYVVVKTEPYDVEFSSIKHESTILNILYSKSCRSIPPTYWYGVDPEPYLRILVMPFYDESVENYVTMRTRGILTNDNKSSAGLRPDVARNQHIMHNIMRAGISVLEHIHNRYVVHRDIKPANWMIRRDELILIDFGLAAFYVASNETHIQPASQPKTHIIGTPKYVSWNVHCGEEYTRRDDLISMVYMGLFLLRGDSFFQLTCEDKSATITCAVNPQNAPFQTPPLDTISSTLSKTECNHPLNQFYKSRKTVENIATLAERWPALKQFAESAYSLAFQERPAYDEYMCLFEERIRLENDINTKP